MGIIMERYPEESNDSNREEEKESDSITGFEPEIFEKRRERDLRESGCVCWDKRLMRKNEEQILLDKMNLEICNLANEKGLKDRLNQIKMDLREYKFSFNRIHLVKVTVLLQGISKKLLKNKETDLLEFQLLLSFVRFAVHLFKLRKMENNLCRQKVAGSWLEIILYVEVRILCFHPHQVNHPHLFKETKNFIDFLTPSSQDLKNFMQNQQIFSVISMTLGWKCLEARRMMIDKLAEIVARCVKDQVFYQKKNILCISKRLFGLLKGDDLTIRLSICRLFALLIHQSRFKALFIKENMLQNYLQVMEKAPGRTFFDDFFKGLGVTAESRFNLSSERAEILRSIFQKSIKENIKRNKKKSDNPQSRLLQSDEQSIDNRKESNSI